MCGAAASPLPAPYLPTTHNTYTHTFSLSLTHTTTRQEERAKARRAVSRVETIATDGGLSLVRVQILTGAYICVRCCMCVLFFVGGSLGAEALFLGRAFLFPTVHIWRAYKTPYGHPQSNDKKKLITPHTQHRADAPDPRALGALGLPRAGGRHVWGPGIHGQEPPLPPPRVRACVRMDAINCT